MLHVEQRSEGSTRQSRMQRSSGTKGECQQALINYKSDFLALVDTGAERSLLEGVHLRAADIDIFAGRELVFQGFLGARTVAYLHSARLRIGSTQLETEVAFSTQPLLRQVLGRDLMAYFALGLREMAMEVYLGNR